VASPHPQPITLAAAYVAGADGLLAVGGAQAIAGLTYGVGPIPPCDAVVGPGNKFVTAAKSLVAGRVAIDMLAGPSECLVGILPFFISLLFGFICFCFLLLFLRFFVVIFFLCFFGFF